MKIYTIFMFTNLYSLVFRNDPVELHVLNNDSKRTFRGQV